MRCCLRCAGPRIVLVVLSCICVGRVAASQAAQRQQLSPVQTGPIDEPRGAERPSGPPVVKGIQAIAEQDSKCSKRLIVNADALFGPRRWTLNPDGSETLDALAPLIAKVGKHPVRIEAFTGSPASPDTYNQMLSEKRAITVRGWLVNHGFVAEGTLIEGFGKRIPVAPSTTNPTTTKAVVAESPEGRPQDQRVEIVIDTCH